VDGNRQVSGPSGEYLPMGECMRYPPAFVMTPFTDRSGMESLQPSERRPYVGSGDYCGEFMAFGISRS
jgi:hypothetical protein